VNKGGRPIDQAIGPLNVGSLRNRGLVAAFSRASHDKDLLAIPLKIVVRTFLRLAAQTQHFVKV
jgi:hypothetical protein